MWDSIAQAAELSFNNNKMRRFVPTLARTAAPSTHDLDRPHDRIKKLAVLLQGLLSLWGIRLKVIQCRK